MTWRHVSVEEERDAARAEVDRLNRVLADNAAMLQKLRDHIYNLRQELHHAQAQSMPEVPCPCANCRKPWNYRETR
jgi:uncharacterized coiled-coil protein SlyX